MCSLLLKAESNLRADFMPALLIDHSVPMLFASRDLSIGCPDSDFWLGQDTKSCRSRAEEASYGKMTLLGQAKRNPRSAARQQYARILFLVCF
jgi:hypothetical protein